MSDSAMIRMKRPAMGCEFELVLAGRDRDYLISAAQEAFELVSRLEDQLSIFVPTSEMCYINAFAATEPVRVSPMLFRLLKSTARLFAATEGAFDITAGALVDLWNFPEDRLPSGDAIHETLASTGMDKVIMEEGISTVRFANQGIKLNLGAIGKGYAAAEVVQFLEETGIRSALVAAGTSTVYALGGPPDDDAWTIGVRDPLGVQDRLTTVRLRNQAFSTSGSHERFVEIEGIRYSHIIDPRTGRPASGLLLACALVDDPVESDALSTAFFINGLEWTADYCRARGGVGAIIVTQESSGEEPVIHRIGTLEA
jgi:thiamine biosynthesis lipoprotein